MIGIARSDALSFYDVAVVWFLVRIVCSYELVPRELL